jgi:hypothetical protein
MKSTVKQASLFVTALALLGLLFLGMPRLAAQQTGPPILGGANNNFNPPPCDYTDQFYQDNGLDPTQLVGRFGSARQTGPPAILPGQVNWVADTNCSINDPNRRNFRILATTGGFSDDNTGNPGHFISILAFVVNQSAFETSYSRTVGAINGGLDGDQQNAGSNISVANSLNPRGISMQFVVSNFEAYPAPTQKLANGTFAMNPCATDMVSPLAPATPCFPVNTVNAVFTPSLRQDWRFATNRNAMDGSDNNCISTNTSVCSTYSDSPFGYFCDDLLGMWINSYFWFVVNPASPGFAQTTCGQIMNSMGQQNGFTADGTPIVATGAELDDQLEANNCAAEGQLAMDGSDGGAIWLVCPAIPDPTAGAITLDAFLDQARYANGFPQNLTLTVDFLSLQLFGVLPTFLGDAQRSQLNSEVARATAPRTSSP